LLKLQHQPQGNYRIVNVTAASRAVHSIRDMPPSVTVTVLGRQTSLDKLANIAKRCAAS
jgi:hypothetical protein